MILCYVAGPLTRNAKGEPASESEMIGNVNAAIDVGNALMDAGVAVIVPHLSYYAEQRKARDYEDWMGIDFALLRRCDCLFRMEGGSPGRDREVRYANRLGIPVFRDLETLVAWARQVGP